MKTLTASVVEVEQTVPFAGRFVQHVPQATVKSRWYSEKNQTARVTIGILLDPVYASNTRCNTSGGDQTGDESN